MVGLLRRTWLRLSVRPQVWLATVLAVNAIIAVTGITIGARLNLSALLAVGPVLACARCNGRITALVAAYSLVLSLAVGVATDTWATLVQRERNAAVLIVGVIAIVVAVIRSRRENRLIRIADRFQRAILRPLPAELGGVAFASRYQSATPGTLVGGDLYDLTMTQFGPRFIIGDVRGKGLDAVGRCAAVIAAFRALAFAEPDLVKLAEQMDGALCGEMEMEDFVTAIFAEFGPGEVHIVNCGHHPPLKTGPSVGFSAVPDGASSAGSSDDLSDGASAGSSAASGRFEILTAEPSAPPLGLHPCPIRQDIVLKHGDRLLFYTDGLVEARDRAGRFLGLDERVIAALDEPSLDACVQRLGRLLIQHSGHALDDDVLLVVCEPAP
jgi:phosphoserine phosphatase RsbU/P